MAFKKSGSGKGDGEDQIPEHDNAMEGSDSFVEKPQNDDDVVQPTAPTAPSTVSQEPSEALEPANHLDNGELSDDGAVSDSPSLSVEPETSDDDEARRKKEEEEEAARLAAEAEKAEMSLDEQLLAGGGMELSDDTIDAPAPIAPSAPGTVSSDAGPAGPVVEDVQMATEEAPGFNGVAPGIGISAKPRLERVVGNGNPLSPNEQRKAALAEKAAAASGYGGGGGIGSLFAAAGQGVKSVLSGVGTGVKRAGGQKLADRFLQPSDPVSVAKRAFRQRYAAYDGAVNEMDAATKARDLSVKNFNDLVLSSAAGRTLNDIAQASNTDLHEFMSDVKSGKNRDPLALRCMETLERDPDLGRAAKKIAAAQDAFTSAEKVAETNLTRLATDHGADINVAFENNRLVDAFEKAETDAKKPLPLEVSLKDSNTGAEDKLDTEKQHKKFMEALEKIKESIAALLSKIMSKLGLGGPK